MNNRQRWHLRRKRDINLKKRTKQKNLAPKMQLYMMIYSNHSSINHILRLFMSPFFLYFLLLFLFRFIFDRFLWRVLLSICRYSSSRFDCDVLLYNMGAAALLTVISTRIVEITNKRHLQNRNEQPESIIKYKNLFDTSRANAKKKNQIKKQKYLYTYHNRNVFSFGCHVEFRLINVTHTYLVINEQYRCIDNLIRSHNFDTQETSSLFYYYR